MHKQKQEQIERATFAEQADHLRRSIDQAAERLALLTLAMFAFLLVAIGLN